MRPARLRMKDSDDYITARAANPRTGLISPSVGTRTPGSNRVSYTPQSPGEALKLPSVEQESPTRDGHSQCRANAGRKLSSGYQNSSAEPQLWHYNSAEQSKENAARPQTRPALVREDNSRSQLHPDQFVVHMPSAEEPQPFAYPGYTSEQIEALEHYRCKSRRVSSDGYDRRMLQSAGKAQICTCCAAEIEYCTNSDPSKVCACPRGHFQPYQGAQMQQTIGTDMPPIMVRKRRGASRDQIRYDPARAQPPSGIRDSSGDGPKLTASTLRLQNSERHLHRAVPGAYPSLHTKKHASCGSHATLEARRGSVDHVHNLWHDENKHHGAPYKTQCRRCASPTLSQTLPPVTLIRPELAAVPAAIAARRAAYHATNKSASRSCSLGCQRDSSTGQCTRQRVASQTLFADLLFPSRPVIAPADQPPMPTALLPPQWLERTRTLLIDVVMSSLRYLRDIHIPHGDVIGIITSPTTSLQDKLAALRLALSLGGHVLAICMSLVLAWKLGAAVVRVGEVLVWPLMVMVTVLRWVVGAG